eukprot:COSAG02_NODE_19679_length_870_cov_0.673152_1_plen_45_part_01
MCEKDSCNKMTPLGTLNTEKQVTRSRPSLLTYMYCTSIRIVLYCT